jgi:hypothetical protein
MTDMIAFERRVADGMVRRAGPVRPVDDLAIFEAITAAQSPVWKVRPLFSATRFVVAGVIVALFGVLLLPGVLTTPRDGEVLPGSATASPTPITTDALLSGMVTEEVEPGVYRVVDDGVRDLSDLEAFGVNSLAIAPDGVVWVYSEHTGLFHLAGAEAQKAASPLGSMVVAADGSVWLTDDGTERIRSFDGATWAEYGSGAQDGREWLDLSTGPDGTVWAVALDTGCSTDPTLCYVPVRIDADGAITDVPVGDDILDQPLWVDDLAVAPDGDVWMTVLAEPGGWDVATLLRYDGTAWEAVAPPEGTLSQQAFGHAGQALGFAPDGTLWIGTSDTPDGNTGLARLDDSGWTVFSAEDGVRPWGTWWGVWVYIANLQVAPDGSVWVNAASENSVDGGCGGIARFDGVTWTTYLAGTCVHDLGIAPDGAVWVEASVDTTSGGPGPVGLFVITPEASLTTE